YVKIYERKGAGIAERNILKALLLPAPYFLSEVRTIPAVNNPPKI
ncbi:unnamed protein product, partial [marine sediment metagenome]